MVEAEGAPHAVTISTFEMDRTEVTVADYARCVLAGPCAPPQARAGRPEVLARRASQSRTSAGTTRRPSAAGPADACRPRRSGSTPRGAPRGATSPGVTSTTRTSPTTASWADDRTDATDGFAGLAPVGSFPDGATPLGLLDMAGNVAEWVADELEMDPAGRPVGYAPASEVDPKPRTGGGGFHVIRGGSYEDGAVWIRSAARDTTLAAAPGVGRLPLRCGSRMNRRRSAPSWP